MIRKEIYIFSGLGADERAFQYLDFSDYNPHFVQWITPYKEETIEQYAKRISSQITHPYPILIGLSFGGMMVIEIAKQIRTEKLIIIASAKNKKEIPFYFRLVGMFNLHKIIPSKFLKKTNTLTSYLFGARTPSEIDVLKQILLDTDPSFLSWAINCIVKWENIYKSHNIIHIHGTEDKILPIHNINSDYKIQKGGHLITLSHAKEIMGILRKEIK